MYQQELSSNLLPKRLPVTERMMQRGYTSANLNEHTLRTMDLSIVLDPDDQRVRKMNKKPRHRLPVINSKSSTMVSTK